MEMPPQTFSFITLRTLICLKITNDRVWVASLLMGLSGWQKVECCKVIVEQTIFLFSKLRGHLQMAHIWTWVFAFFLLSFSSYLFFGKFHFNFGQIGKFLCDNHFNHFKFFLISLTCKCLRRTLKETPLKKIHLKLRKNSRFPFRLDWEEGLCKLLLSLLTVVCILLAF